MRPSSGNGGVSERESTAARSTVTSTSPVGRSRLTWAGSRRRTVPSISITHSGRTASSTWPASGFVSGRITTWTTPLRSRRSRKRRPPRSRRLWTQAWSRTRLPTSPIAIVPTPRRFMASSPSGSSLLSLALRAGAQSLAILIFQGRVAIDGVRDPPRLFLGQRAGHSRRDAQRQVAGRNAVPRRHHGACTDLRAALDHGAVEHPGADADQRAVLDRTAVDHGLMPHHHPLADHQRMVLVSDVQHRTVLDVGARADANPVDVPPGRGVKPEGDVVAGGDVPHEVGAGGQEHPGAQGGPPSLVGVDGHRSLPYGFLAAAGSTGRTERRMRS